MNTPDHLQVTVTTRGLRWLPPIPATHGGQPAGNIQIYDSSAASGNYLWLKVEQPRDRNHPDNGEVIEAIVHVKAENALKLADQIRYLVETR